jgi:acyl-CoA reductase-like NAD-dependent aldehyde dehydrogenase
MLLQHPAAVERFLETRSLSNYIDGKWVGARSGRTHAVMNPSDGAQLAAVPASGAAEVDSAVQAAHRACGGWSALSPAERAVLLHRLADALDRNAKELAAIESLDVGKAISAAEAFDVPFGIECPRYFADLATHAQYDRPLAIKNMEARVHRRP